MLQSVFLKILYNSDGSCLSQRLVGALLKARFMGYVAVKKPFWPLAFFYSPTPNAF